MIFEDFSRKQFCSTKRLVGHFFKNPPQLYSMAGIFICKNKQLLNRIGVSTSTKAKIWNNAVEKTNMNTCSFSNKQNIILCTKQSSTGFCLRTYLLDYRDALLKILYFVKKKTVAGFNLNHGTNKVRINFIIFIIVPKVLLMRSLIRWL